MLILMISPCSGALGLGLSGLLMFWAPAGQDSAQQASSRKVRFEICVDTFWAKEPNNQVLRFRIIVM